MYICSLSYVFSRQELRWSSLSQTVQDFKGLVESGNLKNSFTCASNLLVVTEMYNRVTRCLVILYLHQARGLVECV